jgi:hypothetical protein
MLLLENGRIDFKYAIYIRKMEETMFGGEADRREGNADAPYPTPASIEAAPFRSFLPAGQPEFVA